MAILTVYPNAHPESTSVDGYLRHDDLSGLSWTELRNGVGTHAYPSYSYTYCGWRCNSITNKYDRISRSVFLFDTSALPDDCVINSAIFSVYREWLAGQVANGWDADSHFNIYGSNPASNINLVPSDFSIDHFGADAYCDTPLGFNDDWGAGSGRRYFTLNSLGLSAISKSGITKIGFLEAIYDVGGITPPWVSGWAQFIRITCADNGTNKPKLIIYYNSPVCLTLPATNISLTSATLNGKVLDDGGESCQYRFRYKKNNGSYSYTSYTGAVETNDIFSENINGLEPNSLYYFNARIKTSLDKSEWGNEICFITSSRRRTIDIEDKVTLEAIRNIEMAAKSRFFIDEEGKAIYKSRLGRMC